MERLQLASTWKSRYGAFVSEGMAPEHFRRKTAFSTSELTLTRAMRPLPALCVDHVCSDAFGPLRTFTSRRYSPAAFPKTASHYGMQLASFAPGVFEQHLAGKLAKFDGIGNSDKNWSLKPRKVDPLNQLPELTSTIVTPPAFRSFIDRLKPFFRDGGTMEFPQMTLAGMDGEPAVLEGRGRIEMPTPDKMIVHIEGKPEDLRHSLHAINRLRDNPYDPLCHFRLHMTDTFGCRWSAGCELERIEPGDAQWSFLGWTQGLLGIAPTEPDYTGMSESYFLVPRNYSIRSALNGIISSMQPDGSLQPAVVMHVLGCPVTLHYDVALGMIVIFTPLSETFPAPETENWLGEPLRIILGQPVYPRLVTRRLPFGSTHVHFRVSPSWSVDSCWTALWQAEGPNAPADFLELYRGLLTLIAADRTDERTLKEHKVTSLFGEVIEASKASRWVMTLILASSIEAIVKRIGDRSIPLNPVELQAVEELTAFLDGSSAPERIVKRLKTALETLPDLSTTNAMRRLAGEGIIRKSGVETWNKIRNRVMHGELVSPYSSEKDDKNILELARLFHDLTRDVVRRALVKQLPS